jgi:CelD/BcsL family acetyltransferase involved in cellulose biosynthesis
VRVALEPFDRRRKDEAWRRLWHDRGELSKSAPPFLSPEFFAINSPIAREGDRLIATVRKSGALVGVLPVIVQGKSLLPLKSEHSQHYDYLGDRAEVETLWRALDQDPRWDVMTFKDVPLKSVLAGPLAEVARAQGCQVYVRPSRGSPTFELPGFEARLKPKFRTNLRRCERKLGNLAYERWTEFSNEAFDEGLRIEALAWKGAAGSAIESDPAVEHAYRALARLAARRGQLSLSFVKSGERRIAFLFALEHAGTLWAMKIGYDPEFANVSAGHLVAWKAAEDAERRGLLALDFLGKQDEWKLKWTEQANPYVVVVIYRATARGQLEHTLREIVKPLAPEGLVALARKLPRP